MNKGKINIVNVGIAVSGKKPLAAKKPEQRAQQYNDGAAITHRLAAEVSTSAASLLYSYVGFIS